MSFLGADTDELRSAADECMQGKEITDQVIQYLQALIALLKAASFFSGGASAAYAQYLETVVVPWLQRISAALELFARVLGANADAQDQASQGETVNAGSLPRYTSQVSGDSTVQPFSGSVLGSGNTGAAFGAITGAASSMGDNAPVGSGTQVTVTSPDGTVTTVTTPGEGTTATAPVTSTPVSATPIATTTTDSVIPRDSLLPSSADRRTDDASWVAAGSGAATGGGGGSFAPGGGGGGLGSGSVDGGVGGDSGDAAFTSHNGPSEVHSTAGTGGGTPGADMLAGAEGHTGDPVSASTDGNGTSYGAAGAIAGGAGALGLAGAALAARQGGGTGQTDPTIDRLATENGFGSRGDGVSDLQQRLTDAGYDTQGVDGHWGPNTQAAYDQYRADHPLPIQHGTGYTSPSGYDYNQIRGVRNNPNVTPEFLRALEGVAQRTGAQPEHLMGVMSLETMGTFRPNIQNPDTHATGLIQFIPRTAEGLGTSTAELSRMTPTEQLTYVERYLSQPAYRGRVGTLEGLYSAVLPGRIMESDDVIFRPGTEAYRDNRWLDTDGTPGITLREAVEQVRARMGAGAR